MTVYLTAAGRTCAAPTKDVYKRQVLVNSAVDYVAALTGDLGGDFPQYKVIDQCSYNGGEGEVTWYLYQLQR